MTDLQTDEEKAEAIKKWWKENGVAVVTGLALGLAIMFGWRAWTGYQDRLGQQASLGFEELLMTVNQISDAPAPEPEPGAAPADPLLSAAEAQQSRLQEEFGSTPYVFLGELAMAKAYNDRNDLTKATQALRSAIGLAPNPALKELTAVRLARVLIAAQDYPAATAVIDQHDHGGSFSGDFAALRGDIAAAQGRIDEARGAYELALAGNAGTPGLIRLKLRNLPAPEGS